MTPRHPAPTAGERQPDPPTPRLRGCSSAPCPTHPDPRYGHPCGPARPTPLPAGTLLAVSRVPGADSHHLLLSPAHHTPTATAPRPAHPAPSHPPHDTSEHGHTDRATPVDPDPTPTTPRPETSTRPDFPHTSRPPHSLSPCGPPDLPVHRHLTLICSAAYFCPHSRSSPSSRSKSTFISAHSTEPPRGAHPSPPPLSSLRFVKGLRRRARNPSSSPHPDLLPPTCTHPTFRPHSDAPTRPQRHRPDRDTLHPPCPSHPVHPSDTSKTSDTSHSTQTLTQHAAPLGYSPSTPTAPCIINAPARPTTDAACSPIALTCTARCSPWTH